MRIQVQFSEQIAGEHMKIDQYWPKPLAHHIVFLNFKT